MKPSKRKRAYKKWVVLFSGLILVGIGLLLWFFTRPAPGQMYRLSKLGTSHLVLCNPEHWAEPITITDRKEINEIIDLFNNFTYHTVRQKCVIGNPISLEVVDWWENTTVITFYGDGIWVRDKTWEEGGDTFYLGPKGYFDEIADLAYSNWPGP